VYNFPQSVVEVLLPESDLHATSEYHWFNADLRT